jgi:hypothetical protein
MGDLEAVVYVSSATRPFETEDLDELLLEARSLNRKSGLTGILLYSDGNFMQFFEGTRAAVAETYERIKLSTKHTGIIQLMHDPIRERSFPEWEMGFAHPESSELMELATANWERLRSDANAIAAKPPGMTFLEHFWKIAIG